MKIFSKDAILKEIPLFAGLPLEEQQLIKDRCNIVEYRKDEIIYTEGSPASAFYFVILGRVLTYTTDLSGKQTFLEYLHRGKYFGIISLLTNDPHSVTARALNDCLLLIIKKEEFEFILKKIPALAIDLSQTLSRRIKNKGIHQKTIFESTIVAVFSSFPHAGKSIYALNLGLSLRKETHKSLIIVDMCPKDRCHTLPRRLGMKKDFPFFDLSRPLADIPKLIREFIVKDETGLDLICFVYKPEDESCRKKLVNVLGVLVNDYHYLVLDLPSLMDRFVLSVLGQADQIHLLSSPESAQLKRTAKLIARMKSDFNFQESKLKIVINEYKPPRFTHEQQAAILSHSVFATLPKIEFPSEKLVLDQPLCGYSRVIRRVARESGDSSVGLALGVGAAYGFCHIGVLKVIEEEKIPIDVICGSSMGALIAALWATGKSSGEIMEIMGEFNDPRYIWGLIDLTFPSIGFIKGNKLNNFLKRHFGNKTFYDVRMPLKIVASDIRRKDSRVFDKGPLTDAIMASCAMPGVFRPFRFRGDILLDGGIISPLPTEPLFQMGIKKIIAVNVTPNKEDMLSQYEKVKEQLAETYQAIHKNDWFGLRRYFRDRFKTNILDIIFSSVETMQSEMAQREGQLADIVLHPDTSGMHWMELHRSREFAARGEEEARKNLGRIWGVINE